MEICIEIKGTGASNFIALLIYGAHPKKYSQIPTRNNAGESLVSCLDKVGIW